MRRENERDWRAYVTTDEDEPAEGTAARQTVTAQHNAISACKAAGIAHFHPHDLRHRYASVQIGRGVPVTHVAAQLGHSKKSLTLDTYSHVLVD